MNTVLFAILLAFNFSCITTKNRSDNGYYKVVVEPGDSLASIAARFDTDWRAILRDNNLDSPKQLFVGQVLLVRPGPAGFIAKKMDENPNEGRPNKENKKNDQGTRKGLLFNNQSSIKFSWPVLGTISSEFGKRGWRNHEGIDIRAPHGTPVLAAAGGRVEFARHKGSYGKMIVIAHDSNTTVYAHLSKLSVKVGEYVTAGKYIANVGSSGNATGPHLHFEIRDRKGKPLNPVAFLEPQGTNVATLEQPPTS